MLTKQVPNIERQPRTASDTASHYGYCAYKDIELAGSLGLEHKVQPPESPYYRTIPARQVIPFTNIEVAEIDEKLASAPGGAKMMGKPILPIKKVGKSARECADELRTEYADWGYTVLTPLTGYSVDDAFRIFQVIQPFTYKLKDLGSEISFGAVNRIESDTTIVAVYEGEKVELEPLPADLKEVAEEVRAILEASVSIAENKAGEIAEKTRLSMTSRFAGGPGKTRPDPHDKYVFSELGMELPTLISSEKADPTKEIVNALKSNNESADELKREELELRRKELELREKELEIREKEANAAKMAAVRAAKEK